MATYAYSREQLEPLDVAPEAIEFAAGLLVKDVVAVDIGSGIYTEVINLYPTWVKIASSGRTEFTNSTEIDKLPGIGVVTVAEETYPSMYLNGITRDQRRVGISAYRDATPLLPDDTWQIIKELGYNRTPEPSESEPKLLIRETRESTSEAA